MTRRFRFSLKAMLLATAFVAAVIWLTYLAPSKVGIPVLVLLAWLLGALLFTMAIYGMGSTRPFCIGALFPIGSSLLHSQMGGSSLNLKTFREKTNSLVTDPSMVEFYDSCQGEIGATILFGIVTGLLCVAMHCWLTRCAAAHPDVEQP